MTSYSFSISASWWLVVLCGVCAVLLSWYAYRITTPPIAPLRRIILFALRTVGLWILLFALFEPIVNIIRASEEPPRVAVLLDNSQSVALQDASRNRKADYIAAVKALNLVSLNPTPTPLTLFDENTANLETATFQPDSMRFQGQFSNLAKPLQTVIDNAEQNNIRAVVLFTDGAFNAGENPLYAAEMLGRPIFAVGVGDSTEPRDIGIRSLLSNEIGYVGGELPVSVNVQASGYQGGTAKVILRDNGAVVGEQTLTFGKSNTATENATATFLYKPTEAGMRTLRAEIKNQSGFEEELTIKNNAASEFVNILKNKRKTIVIAGQLTPDISFLRSTLEANQNVQCAVFVEGKNGEFLDDASSGNTPQSAPKRDFKTELAEAEAVMLVGFPVTVTPPAVIEAVRSELSRGKPVLFVASQDLDWVKLRPLETYLPFSTISGSKQEMLALPDVKKQALSSPVMKLSGTDDDATSWNALPPLFRTETLVRVKPGADVLATLKLNNVPLNEPLIVQHTLNNTKSLAILGYGLYRWKLLGFAAEAAKGRTSPDIFGTFFENGLRWLSTSDQGKFVRIKTTRKLYGSGEKVEFTGQVYDKSYNPLDAADVRVVLQSAVLKQPREVVLSTLGGGRYSAVVEGLGQGEYNFAGTATVNGQKYGEDAGRFSVGEVNIEFQNIRMNAAFLRRLAETTGGAFFTAEEVARNPDNLKNAIKRHRGFQARPVTLRSDIPLWNLAWLLGVAIVCFALEWFLRKRSGMV